MFLRTRFFLFVCVRSSLQPGREAGSSAGRPGTDLAGVGYTHIKDKRLGIHPHFDRSGYESGCRRSPLRMTWAARPRNLALSRSPGIFSIFGMLPNTEPCAGCAFAGTRSTIPLTRDVSVRIQKHPNPRKPHVGELAGYPEGTCSPATARLTNINKFMRSKIMSKTSTAQ